MASPAARIQAQQRQMQGKDVTCEKCGSMHFHEEKITRYTAGGTGSVEIMQAPDAQEFSILVCLCGFPVSPKVAVGRRAHGIYETAHTEFRDSVTKAQHYLKETSVPANPKAALESVLEVVAGKQVESKVTTLENQMEDVRDRLFNVESKALAPQHDEAEKAHKTKANKAAASNESKSE